MKKLGRSQVLVAATVASSVALFAACSATTQRNITSFTGGSTTTGTAHTVTSGGGSENGPTSGSGLGGGITLPESGPPCAAQCSDDFHTVVDCNGNTLQTCSGSEACDSTTGKCADACTAAVDNKSSVGCEYYATDMDQYAPDYCFAAFVANTWTTPVHISVDFAGAALPVGTFAFIPSGVGPSLTYAPYDATGGLPPGQVAILFLAGTNQDPGNGSTPCPQPTAMPTEMAQLIQQTGTGNSFHITTDVPVVSYEINPYGGGSAAVTGASLLLPTSAWDVNYIGVTVAPYNQDSYSPSMNIIASEDATTVTLLPTVAIEGGGTLPAGPANVPYMFTLNKGQMAQFTQQGDLTGSVISSNHPIGIMAGQPCEQWPIDTDFCDHGEQMVPPVKALGSEYVGVMYRPRVPGDAATWHLVGAVDGTVLTYTPSPAPPGAPVTLTQGQVVNFVTDQPFDVKSQDSKHPFLMFSYMSGSSWSMLSDMSGYGDPDFVLSVPPQQYLNNYVFFADPTYPETNLVVIRRPNAKAAFDDVTLDCAGILSGWTPVGDYEWTRVDLITGDFQPVGNCTTGRHQMSSATPFGLWVWGWGTPNTSTFTANVSYGYPGGMNVQPINTVVIPPTPTQ